MRINQELRGQLTRLDEWLGPDGKKSNLTLLDYVGFEATPEIFLAICELLNPSLIQVDGARFLSSRFEKEVFDEWQKLDYSMTQIQLAMNQIRARTIIQHDSISDDLARYLLEVIADFWSMTITGCVTEIRGTDFGDLSVSFSDGS